MLPVILRRDPALARGIALPDVIVEARPVPALLLRGEAGRESTVREVLRPIMEELPRGQQIGQIHFTDQPMPRTATGKVKRWEIGKEEH